MADRHESVQEINQVPGDLGRAVPLTFSPHDNAHSRRAGGVGRWENSKAPASSVAAEQFECLLLIMHLCPSAVVA